MEGPVRNAGVRGLPGPAAFPGECDDDHFTQNDDSTSSQGHTNATSISIGGPITKFLLKGLDSTLTAGYSSETCTETTVTSQVNQNIQLSLKMIIPDCSQSNSYTNWQVQPYLLQATDYTAPWVPQNYALNLPWCITWFAKGTACPGSQMGNSPPPDAIEGSISGSGRSSYSVRGGKLVWVEDDGGTTPIPMTADTFDPAAGAVLELNGHELHAIPSVGKWARAGQVWKFKAKSSAGRTLLALIWISGRGRGTSKERGCRFPTTSNPRTRTSWRASP